MALSGTSLTVTTLTTAGLLTNNVSGQVSSVTGSSLGTLLGGAPTFTGLTLSGLGTGVLKVTSGVIGLATSGEYQAPISNGTNISLTGSGTIINVVSNPSFAGLTLSGGTLANTMLKTVAGVISPATVNNDYQAALTAGSNLLFTTNNTVINTVTNPTFAGINCSSIGTNNTLLGTFAGSNLLSIGLGSNTLCGYQAGVNITSGTYNTCIGNSTGTGITSGANNTFIGNSTGTVTVSGSNGVYIGNAANASGSAISNEGVINLSGLAVTGKGANTMLINASAGLFTYSPYSMNLWNNNAATISQVEQWVLNNTANSGIANIGTTPTITSGVITNIPVGVYNFNITGTFYGSSQTYYPTLQYKANGGSFVRIALAMPSFGSAWTCPFSINANIRISNVADAIRLWYDTSNPGPYNNVGSIPVIYYGNYLPRYMTITFISL